MPISEHRQFLNDTLMPRWAKQFGPTQTVYDIGVSKWDYSEHFGCAFATVDRDASRKPDLVRDLEKEILVWCDGIILNGVFEQADDPFKLIRNVHRSLKPGGKMLAGLIGNEAPWTSSKDRWRVTPEGGFFYLRNNGFEVVKARGFEGYQFIEAVKV